MLRDVYSGNLNLNGEEHSDTLMAANNYANSLIRLKNFEEAKTLMRRAIPVARRLLGDPHDLTLRMRWHYAMALYKNEAATLDELREAVTTLEETERSARRVVGSAHPLTENIEGCLREARVALRARETSP